MFIRFFKASFIPQYVMAGIAGALLWLGSFLFPPSMPSPGRITPLYTIIYDIFSALPLLSTILAFLITLVTGFILNLLLTRQEINPKNSLLGAFLFISISGCILPFQSLNPVLATLPFFLVILDKMFRIYGSPEDLALPYTAGFLVSAASMLYFPFLPVYLLVIAVLVTYRTFYWRDWMSSFIGVITPYLFLFIYYFLTDQFIDRLLEYKEVFVSYLPVSLRLSPDQIAFLVFVGILILVSLFSFYSHQSEKTIEVRKKGIILLWAFFLVLLILPFSAGMTQFHLVLLMVPSTAFICNFMASFKKPGWVEAVFMLFLAGLLVRNLVIHPF